VTPPTSDRVLLAVCERISVSRTLKAVACSTDTESGRCSSLELTRLSFKHKQQQIARRRHPTTMATTDTCDKGSAVDQADEPPELEGVGDDMREGVEADEREEADKHAREGEADETAPHTMKDVHAREEEPSQRRCCCASPDSSGV
jgi:hypothetical protein